MITRIFEIPGEQLASFPKEDALNAKENGTWKSCSTQSFISQVNDFSYGLIDMGLKKDDKIALISNNRPEWNIIDLGMQQAGVINVPVYLTLSESEFAFILNDAEVKYVFVSDEQLFTKISSIRKDLISVAGIYSIEPVAGAMNWNEILERGSKNRNAGSLMAIKDSIKPDDIVTILYTSGTTGVPKGVMLTHNNIISNILATQNLLPVDHHGKALSFLPLCHSYERMLTYLYMFHGISIFYAEGMDKIADNIREVKPDIFSTVPRLLEKVYDRILEKGKDLHGIKKKLFDWALRLGLRYELDGANGWWYEMQLRLANKLIFVKWREALGGRVKAIVSGGAALQPRLARVFWAGKIVVLEGYGLTETSPVVAVNNLDPHSVMFGTVGPVISGVEVKFGDDGEILCKGPNIMKGYYKRSDLTSEVIDKEGWFHTGDIGTLVEGRFLKITDRKKEIFKTSGGKYIAPQALENKLKESVFIEQVMVIGENQKFPAALIVPAFPRLEKWCEQHQIAWHSFDEMVKNNEVIRLIRKEVNELNKDFGQTEQIKKFALIPVEWSVANGELTPTMKLKRKVIMSRYEQLVKEIYDDSDALLH